MKVKCANAFRLVSGRGKDSVILAITVIISGATANIFINGPIRVDNTFVDICLPTPILESLNQKLDGGPRI